MRAIEKMKPNGKRTISLVGKVVACIGQSSLRSMGSYLQQCACANLSSIWVNRRLHRRSQAIRSTK